MSTAGEINICQEPAQPDIPQAEIEVCKQTQDININSEIEVCPNEDETEIGQKPLPNPCDLISQLIISGSETPSSGTTYSASGGLPPYTWSFPDGIISDSGEITSINSCGSSGSPRWSTVTVTDTCGQSAEIKVRLPNGQWVNIPALTQGSGGYDSFCPSSSGAIYNLIKADLDEIFDGCLSNIFRLCYSGEYRYRVEIFGCTAETKLCSETEWSGTGSCSTTHYGVPCMPSYIEKIYYAATSSPCTDYREIITCKYVLVDEWQCP